MEITNYFIAFIIGVFFFSLTLRHNEKPFSFPSIMSKIYKSADELIGRTPLLELTHIEKSLGLQAKIYGKLEYFNPAGSVKDRIAKAMIEDCERFFLSDWFETLTNVNGEIVLNKLQQEDDK